MSFLADKDYSAIVAYAESFTSDESDVLRELRDECERNYEDKSMLSGFVQGRVLAMFSKMIRPKIVLEVGTYLGYSALCFAEGLVEGGKVITLDIQEDTNKVARSFVERSKYKDSIEFHLGFATEIIPTLPETFDLVFIDADKPNYSTYYDLVFDKVRAGGFIIAIMCSGAAACSTKRRTRTQWRYTSSTVRCRRMTVCRTCCCR
jgi:caffeoyl-CoA O-methyltransferase